MGQIKRRLVKGAAITATTVTLIGGFEGLRLAAYRDPVGIPTVCFGETRNVHMGDKYTKAQCQDMLAGRLGEFEDGVNACLKHPEKVPDNVYIAVISFSYNVGVKAFCGSTMKRLIDEARYPEACDELPKWVYARGHIYLPGLANRRNEERAICRKYVPWS